MKSPGAVLGDTHAVKCELAAEVLRSSGMLRLQVTGWSMLPMLWPGDTLIIERSDPSGIARGDIVLFGRDRRLFVHRVVATTAVPGDTQFLTRGDAMTTLDPPVSGGELLGRVSLILRDGAYVWPSRSLRLPERALAGLIRHSELAARVVVGMRHMLQPS